MWTGLRAILSALASVRMCDVSAIAKTRLFSMLSQDLFPPLFMNFWRQLVRFWSCLGRESSSSTPSRGESADTQKADLSAKYIHELPVHFETFLFVALVHPSNLRCASLIPFLLNVRSFPMCWSRFLNTTILQILTVLTERY